jgi:predicted  nucleic acid-binding Zn-ribbon protein
MHERAGFFEKRKINAELEEIRKNLSKAQSNANALRHSLESLSARSEGLTKLVIARRQRVGTPAKESEEDLRRRLGELEKIHYL